MDIKRYRTRPLIVLLLSVLLIFTVWVGCQKMTDTTLAPNEQSNAEASARTGAIMHDISRVMAVQDRHTDELLARRGVVGTATVINPDGGYAIKIMTSRRGLEGQLPSALEDVPVIVAYVGEIKAQAVYTDRYRPVECGVSGGSYEYYRENNFGYVYDGGTIGCIVTKGGKRYFLSNNHVFAHSNKEEIGTPVVQPGLIDVGGVKNPDDIVGYLSDYKVIKWHPLRNSNDIDAAIAEIAPGVEALSRMICGYTPSSTPVEATLGMQVKKCGRTTGLTYGEVTGVNVTIVVNYMPDGYARYDDQIGFTNISDSGDSGSLIVTQDGNHPVALLFAGSDTATFGNPIQAVLDYFGVDIES